MASYQKLLTPIGLTAFWLCFSSLWAQRAGQRLEVPLNLFKNWAPEHQRAENLAMIAIFICWPFVLATLYLLWRVAQQAPNVKSRWQRLPAPFDLLHGLHRKEKSAYRLFFILLFWAIPMIHVGHFAVSFFKRGKDQTPIFHWNGGAWVSGEDASGNDMMYGGLTYFGWTPLLVIAAFVGIIVLNVAWMRSLLRKVPSA